MKLYNNIEYYVYPLNENMIHCVGNYVLDNSSLEEMDKICIIFGGKRPGLVLKKYLAERIKHSFVPPKIFSIEEFVSYIVSKYENISYINDIDAIYLLYKIVKNKYFSKDTFETFYAFIPWGYEIYNFIEQLNLEDIPVENLLKINHFITAESGIPSSITKLVKSIIEINNKFYLQLEEKKLYTRSKVFKLASIYARDIQLNEFKKIIFVTPFYLHKTELDLIKLLQNNNKIVIFFQTDTSFNTKNGNSCWQAFQRIEKYLGVEIKLQNQKEELTPRIYFYSAFDKEAEINFVHQILKELDRNEIEKTVVVLPDDEISTVLLHALPETVEEFNLVCGYPLKRSTIYCFLKTIFISQINKKNESYYTKYYIDTITHPLVRNLNCNLSSEIVSLIVQTIESVISGKIEDATLSKSIFVNLKDIESNSTIYKSITNALLSKNNVVPISKIKKSIRLLHWMLFEQWEKVETFSEFCNAVKILLDAIFNQNVVDKNLFNLKVIEKLYDMINIFNSAMFVNEKFTVEEMFKVFLSEIERVKISLIGSPVRGLQILGFYETRNLNFENVIIVDVNEGVLPFLKTKSILIPREILLQLGIDRIEIEEEIQRYHFKRLIASAKNVHLIYVETDQHERSRYVEELIWEQQKKKKELKIENIISGFFQVNFKVKKRDIKKTKDIIEYLKTMIYSTSALDIYLQCPLKFYFNYVLSLEEEEVYVDEPESKDIGNFIHSLLEQTFSPYKSKLLKIDGKFYKQFFEVFNVKFDKELKKQFKTEAYLVKEVMKFYLSNFIFCEQKRIEKYQVEQIIMLEQKFYDEIKLDDGKTINFSCKIDRVDKLADGRLIVIDYKTGKTPIMNKDIRHIELSRENIKKKIKSFQLPLYVYIVNKQFDNAVVDAMFYNIKEPEKINLLFEDNEKMSREEIMTKIFEALNYITSEILNAEISFYADDADPNQCKFCDYNNLCR